GAALHDVCDVYILALDSHSLDHVVEQLSGASHKGLTLRVFIGARALAHKHQLRLRIANSEHNLFPSLLVEHAAGAVAQILADDLQRLYRIAHTLLRLERDHFENIFLDRNWSRDRHGLSWTHFFSWFKCVLRDNDFRFVQCKR